METSQVPIHRGTAKQNGLYSYPGMFFSTKEMEVPSHTTWMNLENITVSDRSQTQKDKYYIIPVIRSTQNRQMQTDRKLVNGGRELGGGETRSDSVTCTGFPLRGEEVVSRQQRWLDSFVRILDTPELYNDKFSYVFEHKHAHMLYNFFKKPKEKLFYCYYY
jgi:hypothetical protein